MLRDDLQNELKNAMKNKDMKTVRFQLETLTCPTCVAKIEGALNKQKGVENATVLFNSSRVKITFNSEEVSAEELQKVVENVGYPVLSS